jgi:TPR repeat protein
MGGVFGFVLIVGDAEAMMGLSKWYLCGGEGFTANEEKAFTYAERAAKQGLPQAEFAMGKETAN